MPTSMATVLLSIPPNTFCGVWWACRLAPYLAVRFIPHRQFCLPKPAHLCFSVHWTVLLRHTPGCTHLEFENAPRPQWAPKRLIVRFTAYNRLNEAQLSWGKLRGEPAIRRFDRSFAPIPGLHDRFARQNRYGPPPAFPPASSYPGIVHHLSGRILLAPPHAEHGRRSLLADSRSTLSLRLQVFRPFDSQARYTPWSVLQDGSLTEPIARESTTLLHAHFLIGSERWYVQSYNTPRGRFHCHRVSRSQWVLTHRRTTQ